MAASDLLRNDQSVRPPQQLFSGEESTSERRERDAEAQAMPAGATAHVLSLHGLITTDDTAYDAAATLLAAAAPTRRPTQKREGWLILDTVRCRCREQRFCLDWNSRMGNFARRR